MTTYFGTTAVLGEADIDYVSAVIKEAGRLAVQMRGAINVTQKTGPRDIVTDADIALSKLIVGLLQQRFPEDAVVSEEDDGRINNYAAHRVWLVDPIDGTEYYVASGGMYSVMIGLLVDGQPLYGWVYNPCLDSLYLAQPNQQVWRTSGNKKLELPHVCLSLNNKRTRLMMGNRDREQFSWTSHVLRGAEWIDSGSIGLCVARILEGSADVYIHLAGKLKTWDTAAPAAMAAASGLEVGSLEFDGLNYGDAKDHTHQFPVIIGRRGSLAWARANLKRGATTPFAVAPSVVSPPVG